MGESIDLGKLTAGLKARREEAWGRVYALTHLPLLRLLRRTLRDHNLAEEALQATFLTAIERIGSFDARKGAIDAWLSGIARNKAHETAREHRTLLRGEPVDLPDPAQNGGAVDRELVALALDRLEPRYAEVLRRKYLAEESLETMAAALGLKQATVGTLLHRGRERFREVYQRLLARTETETGRCKATWKTAPKKES